MTETEWLACTDPQGMLGWLGQQGKWSERKARLFSVAVCRRLWPVLTDERSRTAVEVAERQAEGRADEAECGAAGVAATQAYQDTNARRRASRASGRPIPELFKHAAAAARLAVGYGPLDARSDARGVAAGFSLVALYDIRWHGVKDITDSVCPTLLRGIVNPFHTGPFDPAWRTSTVDALATTMYADRAFDRLPVLADALEEAGCTDAELLDHLRGPGPFVRGDWALDLILGRE